MWMGRRDCPFSGNKPSARLPVSTGNQGTPSGSPAGCTRIVSAKATKPASTRALTGRQRIALILPQPGRDCPSKGATRPDPRRLTPARKPAPPAAPNRRGRMWQFRGGFRPPSGAATGPGGLVRVARLELARLAAEHFECSASTIPPHPRHGRYTRAAGTPQGGNHRQARGFCRHQRQGGAARA